MKNSGSVAKNKFISNEIIFEQLKKILISTSFIDSAILRNFLSYIVFETLSGHSEFLKEYNIGVSVLNKPKTFNPNQTVIVRVHAMRLRSALREYYQNQGLKDSCIISIPKGGYVPTFDLAETIRPESDIFLKPTGIYWPDKKSRIAVLPFKSIFNDSSLLPFVDSMAMTISSELVKFNNLSVLSYYTSKQLCSKNITVKDLASNFGIRFIVTGNLLFDASNTKVSIQLVDAETDSQIWVQNYYFDWGASNVLDIGKNLVSRIMDELTTYRNEVAVTKTNRNSIEREPIIANYNYSKKDRLKKKNYWLSPILKTGDVPLSKKIV
jgi:TolB-like protein